MKTTPALIKRFFFSLLFLTCFLFFPSHSFAQVVLNEFLPNPVTGQNEWVELYNLGASPVDLSNWILTDTANNDKTLSHLGSLPANGFALYEYPSGDGWLNNDGDTLYLKENSNLIDSYSYNANPGEGITFGRSPNGTGEWFILESATPNSSNSQPVPTLAPTSSPSSSTGTYKINEPKDEDGHPLSQVEIHVDGQYIHHWAPEEITFGDGLFCDDDKNISCPLGQHTLKLVKSGYQDWSETKTINAGDYHQVSPVLKKSTPTATPSPSPTPTPKKTPTPSPSPTPTESEEPSPSPPPEEEKEDQPGEVLGESTHRKIDPLAFFFIGGGLFLMAISLAFFKPQLFLKIKKLFQKKKEKTL